MRGVALKLVIGAVAVLVPFAALLLVMIQSQADLLFPIHAVPEAGPAPRGAERWEIAGQDGNRLHGIHIPPTQAAGGKLLLVGFGGNAWNAQHVATYLHQAFPEAHVVAFHYRGYRPSTGSPSADALMDDAPLVLDEAVRRIGPDQMVAVGFSIGSGVAASLSRRRELAGLILVTPFDSLKAVAQDLFPWLPVGPFFQHEMPAAVDLADGRTPVAILAAEHDEIIAPARTASLRRQVPKLIYDRIIGGAGHNDIYQRDEFERGLLEALHAIISVKK